jgi:hypothetical protein
MKNKVVISLCISGLANRIDSLLGGLYWSQQLGYDFKFVWEPDAECMCTYDELFTSYNSANITYSSLEKLYKEEDYKIFCGIVDKVNFIKSITTEWRRYESTPRKLKFLSSLQNDRWYSSKNIDQNCSDLQRENVIIYHNPETPSYLTDEVIIGLLKTFKLNKHVIEKAESFIISNSIDNNTKGILLRKHFGVDRSKLFDIDEASLKNTIINDTTTKYYLMSDSALCESNFKELSNIFIYPKRSYVFWDKEFGHWHRDKESVIDALIGLLILSKTNIQSPVTNDEMFYSSFLNLGYLYSNLELQDLI